MSDFTGKTVLVTGSSRGIGLAIAKAFDAAGANLILHARSEIQAETLAEFQHDVQVLQFDIADATATEASLKALYKQENFQGIDILLAMGLTPEDFAQVVNVNLNGTFNVTQPVFKKMIRQKHGVIINLSSVVGLMGNMGQTNYAASKAGIIGLTKSLAKEGARRHIRVNAIAPGMIVSDMTAALPEATQAEILKNIPLARFGQVDEVAQTALFLAENDYITGQTITVDAVYIYKPRYSKYRKERRVRQVNRERSKYYDTSSSDRTWRSNAIRIGIKPITKFDASETGITVAGQVDGFDPALRVGKRDAHQALENAGLKADADADVPTTVADPTRFESIPNMVSGNVSLRFGAKGINSTIVTACASATNAIGEAFWRIQSGEGSGILVIESLEHAQARGAHILAELVGYGASSDAYHMTSPSPDGEGAARAMRDALNDANLDANQISYINAHGTATGANDSGEAHAIATVFGENTVPVSSTKGMTGHLLGAAGAIEALISVGALTRGELPVNVGVDEQDDDTKVVNLVDVNTKHQAPEYVLSANYDIEEIRQLIADLENSSLREFEVTDGDFNLHLSKNEAASIINPVATTQNAPQAPAAPVDAPHALAQPETAGVEIVAPMVGTVYLQPKPEAPMFKQVGDKVTVGETVAVIEAMKLMTEIHSEVSGTISEILVEK
ncbi:hypothetical protein Pfo_028132 [Paulownia fortunei]|nr:hypothetical protein Pfo_028132 [Paulownia fortunei]